MSAFKKYNDNFLIPRKVHYNDMNYDLYQIYFKSINNIYNFLKTNPKTNEHFFTLASIENDFDFAGLAYEETLEKLNEREGFDAFLKFSDIKLDSNNSNFYKYKNISSLVGGHVSIPRYNAGNPFCYNIPACDNDNNDKFITVHISLSYGNNIIKKQVYNRAIIIINIINALQKAGYNVKVNLFSMTANEEEYLYNVKNNSEIVYINIGLKKFNGKLDILDLYKSLCMIEFYRRIIFRIIEISDVKNYRWQQNYGYVCEDKMIKSILNLPKNELYFGNLNSSLIKGTDIVEDFWNVVDKMNLNDKIDLKETEKGLQRIKNKYN